MVGPMLITIFMPGAPESPHSPLCFYAYPGYEFFLPQSYSVYSFMKIDFSLVVLQ